MIALLVGVVAVPVTSTALFMNTRATEEGGAEIQKSIFEQASGDRSMLRARRRMYQQGVEAFEKARRTNDDAIMPNINDPDSIERAINQNEQEEEVHEAAPVVSTLTADELNMQDRLLLRRYTRARFCPEGLKDFRVTGFYDLCVGLVGSSVSRKPVTGLLNHSAYLYRKLRGAAPELSPFKLRMKMMEQAQKGTKRDTGKVPGRPTTCVMNPDCLEPRYNN